jgi:tetratricopeptide (TPR) repeat protein
MSDFLWKSFSVSKFISMDMSDPAWEHYKNLGNESMKVGDYHSAASLYHTASNISVGPLYGGNFSIFTTVLKLWPCGTAGSRLGEMNDILEKISAHLIGPFNPVALRLPDGTMGLSWPPNMAAGISFGNESAALLAAGNAVGALQSAELATLADPSYVKGHYREMRALEALGQSEAAEEKRQQISEYEKHQYPLQYINLMNVQWITPQEARCMYAPIVRKQVLDSVAKALAPDAFGSAAPFVMIQAMLVPFTGGQGLLLRLDYFPPGASRLTADLDFVLLDPDNAATVELPPHGRASRRSAKNAPRCILRALEWVHGAGLQVIGVVGCQGLAYPQACRAIASHLAAHGRTVEVTPSSSTHASDLFQRSLDLARDGPPHALTEALAASDWDPDTVWGLPPDGTRPRRAAAQGIRLRLSRRGAGRMLLRRG